ncbi:MAG: DUF2125 domain-containing protein [Rhodobacteraceae bacterium]|nr:DUF2125 domain-containing protein [Paracoccaceae bacterium]
MDRFIGMAAGVLTASLLTSTAAGAITADQVWSSMQARLSGLGMTVAADSQAKSGGTLAVKGLKITAITKGGTIGATVAELDFTEGGDGSVKITPPASIPITFASAADQKPVTSATATINQTGASTVVTGADGDMTYTGAADTVAVMLNSLTTDGKAVDLRVKAAMNGVKGTSHLVGTSPQHIDSTSSIAGLSFMMDATNPDGPGTMHAEATSSNLAGTGKMTTVPGMDMTNMSAALAAGYAVDSSMTYGATTFAFKFDQAPKTSASNGSVAGGNITVSMDKSHLQYGGGSNGLDVTVESSQSPIPSVTLKMVQSAFNILLPVGKSDTPQDFALLTKLNGVAVNDELWAMVDPKGALPHDPATVILDLAGKGKWAFDFFDPAQAAKPPAIPGELDSLTLNQLQVTAAGADLSGTGAVTFDNSQGPMPKPTGSVDLKLVGGNGLIDKLTKMGLVPQDQAMGARMMLGMFAKPGEGEDTMTSKIEFNADGSIMANGQRIQ